MAHRSRSLTPSVKAGRRRPASFFGPVILIGLGTLFLLNNFGLITWDIWRLLLQFWPILLVAAGLDVLSGRRSVFSGLMSVLFTVLVLVFIALAVQVGGTSLNWNLDRLEIAQPLPLASEAEITIGFDAGSLSVEALPANSTQLAEGTLYVTQKDDPQPYFQEAKDGPASFSLNSRLMQITPLLQRWDHGSTWTLDLSPDLTLTLAINTGVGFNRLDFSRLKVARLDVQGIYGETQLRLPAQGDMSVNIHQSHGKLIVEIPKGLAAQIRLASRFGAWEVDDKFLYDNGVYRSPGYATARNRVDLRLSGDFSRIIVRQADLAAESSRSRGALQ